MEEMNITKNLENLFNKIIKKDYLKQYDSSKEWYENVRNYIDKTSNKLDDDIENIEDIEDMDDIREQLTDDLSEKIVSEGFHLFVSDKCANVDEDEFDTENDLAPSEWETLDDIILYYYHQMYY